MLCRIQIIGRLGQDPDVRSTTSGQAVTTISVASTETWKDKSGQKQESTEWTNVTMFGRLAEIAGQYLKKGSLVYCEGKKQTRQYQDKKTGENRYSVEMVCNELKMLGGTSGQDNQDRGSNPSQNRNKAQTQPQSDFDDGQFDTDIPF